MTHPNLVRNASILAAVSGGFTSNLWRILFRDSEGKTHSVHAEQGVGNALSDECRAQMNQDGSQPPSFDLLLTDYGTVATFAPCGELDHDTAQEILDYVG